MLNVYQTSQVNANLLARQKVDIIKLELQRLLIVLSKTEANRLFESRVQSVHDELSSPDLPPRQKDRTYGIAQALVILICKVPAQQIQDNHILVPCAARKKGVQRTSS